MYPQAILQIPAFVLLVDGLSCISVYVRTGVGRVDANDGREDDGSWALDALSVSGLSKGSPLVSARTREQYLPRAAEGKANGEELASSNGPR